jgi:hypothetical protein
VVGGPGWGANPAPGDDGELFSSDPCELGDA